MKQQQQDSLNNLILGLELNVVYIQDQSTSRYLSKDVIKAFKIIEKEQKRLDGQLKECQAIKRRLQNKSQQIDAKLRSYQQLEAKFNRAANEKINQIRNEQRVRINNIPKYLTISNITLLLMVICFCLASYFFYQRIEGTDQRLNRQLNILNQKYQVISEYIKELNETAQKDSDNIKKKLNEIEIQGEKQEVIQILLAKEKQKQQKFEREKELETRLIKASFWWGGSWSELEQKELLNLSWRNLGGLPEKLCTLTQLKVLYLGGNKLKFLPQNIGALKELQTLQLQWNQLAKLPESLGNLKELRQLWLSRNQLTKLPQSLGNLRELTQLYLHYNQLTELPESLGNLTKLETLYLHNNQLSSLPTWIGQLKFLKRLSFEKNKITEIPESFQNLKQITYFSFDLHLISEKNIFKAKPISSFTKLNQLWLYYPNADQQRIELIKKECKQRKITLYLNGSYQYL